nr:MAG TPA: hypothetical protein [Bacteriophage sp.]
MLPTAYLLLDKWAVLIYIVGVGFLYTEYDFSINLYLNSHQIY